MAGELLGLGCCSSIIHTHNSLDLVLLVPLICPCSFSGLCGLFVLPRSGLNKFLSTDFYSGTFYTVNLKEADNQPKQIGNLAKSERYNRKFF